MNCENKKNLKKLISNLTSKEKLLIDMLEYLKKMSRFTISSFIIYLLINALFVLKYGGRQDFMPTYLLLFFYVFTVCSGLYLLFKVKKVLNKMKYFNRYFIAFSLIICILFIYANIHIDGSALQVDRWSAMDVSIHAILNGEYPYIVQDHLGQTSSNLPGLFYIGLPFYLMGDVGFLQPFVFSLSFLFILKIKIEQWLKVVILFLFLISPAYLWEIFSKSDLMSNLILLLLFMYAWNNKFQGAYFKRSILLAFICAFFFLTRAIVVIPLVLFLFRDFIKVNNKIKLKFVLSFFLAIVLISLPVLITLSDFDSFVRFNPFNHQTKYAPTLVQIIGVILPFFIAIRIKAFSLVLRATFIMLSLLLFTTFILNILEEGFVENLYGNLFDISYLSMILPFTVVIIIDSLKINTMHA